MGTCVGFDAELPPLAAEDLAEDDDKEGEIFFTGSGARVIVVSKKSI